MLRDLVVHRLEGYQGSRVCFGGSLGQAPCLAACPRPWLSSV